jgi:HEAT repeat protein
VIFSADPCEFLLRSASSTVLVLIFWGILSEETAAQDQRPPRSVSSWTADLQGEDLLARRRAAIATRSADRLLQKKLLPVLVELLMSEKDGQVRLAVLDTVTDMGSAAEAAVPALVHTLRTDYGGKRNEELHQDYRSALALAAIGEPAVEGLRSLLGEQKVNVRTEAAMGLGRIGPQAADAIDDLIQLFGDEQARVRQEAAVALGKIGEPALEPLLTAATGDGVAFRVGAIRAMGPLSTPDKRPIQVLLEAARDAEPQLRAAAVTSLAARDVPPEVELQVLRENLQHDNEIVRAAAVNVFVKKRSLLQQIESKLIGLLTGGHDGVASHAAYLLKQSGEHTAPMLVGALRHDGSRIEQIAEALAMFGRPVVDLLTEAIRDPDPRVRQGAALALSQIRPLSDETVQKLADGLDDPDREVQAAFLTSIGHVGSRGRAAIAAVREKLRDESAEIREQAIGILFAAAPKDGMLVDDFSSMLADDEPRVQRQAIDAIRSLGPLGRRTLPSVIEKIASSDPDVRLAAATMIGSHGRAAAEAVPALISLLGDPAPELRALGAQTLSQLGAAALPAFGNLTVLLNDEEVAVRVAAVGTVANLDLEPEEARPHLAKALQDEESDVRRAALRGIRRFGRRGAIFIPDLILLAANDRQSGFVGRALRRYERYGPDTRSVPELIERLEHEHQAVRLLAVKFLGLAGPAAADAIPDLERLSADPSEEVREQALAALGKINGQPAPTSGESDSNSAL